MEKLPDYTVVPSVYRRTGLRMGDYCIDATCGNGHDTLLLCRLAGSDGLTAGFDIQEQAVEKTKKTAEGGRRGRKGQNFLLRT